MTLLKAATYNLLDGGQARPTRGLAGRLPDQLALLRDLDLDILCLQEGKNWHRDKHHTVYAVAEQLRMQALFAPSPRHGCHLVILYRWPRLVPRVFEPDLACGTFHHTAALAQFAIQGHGLLNVINTHLNPFDPTARRGEVGWLTEYAKPGRDTLLSGDLNFGEPVATTPDELTARIPADEYSRHLVQGPDGAWTDEVDLRALHALLGADFVDPPAALGLPIPRTAGYWTNAVTGQSSEHLWDHRSDYTLLSPALAPALYASEVIDTPAARLLSDHLPVTVTLDLDADRA
ncbi:endonuclease/exonuclease/phosphatase family protein [Streptomyces sp. NPDC057654]|uniref:endonuclease/exonuclease/phosphatase family protein n=1 Tax=Streptomyces sp. NPDC057654 TaxID=3346196 RepID=UPI00368136F1